MPRRRLFAIVLSGALAFSFAPAAPSASAAPAVTSVQTTSAVPAGATSVLVPQGKKQKAKKRALAKKRAIAKKRALAKKRAAARKKSQQQTSSGGALSYSPRAFVGGQALTFSGRLGIPGARRIVLQQHMGRPGDGWFAVPGFSGTTDGAGGFRFQAPAPGMFNIRYRVVAPGSRVTPGVLLAAKTQDSLLTVSGQPRAGSAFRLAVDTTPDLDGRPDVRGVPAFPGRTLTLQKRGAGAVWTNVTSTIAGSDGMGYFTRTESAGQHVYRVMQEPVRSGATQLGATPSFPTFVTVGSGGSSASGTSPFASGWSQWAGNASSSRVAGNARSLSGSTASGSNRWGAMLWDFAWERGEGLADGPYKGTVKRGSWVDYTDGTGRASKHNGGLSLDSSRAHGSARSDRGTTMATMQGNARAYGRWETRLRFKVAERNATDYRVRAELVPADPADYACGRHNILIGELRPLGKSLVIGAKKGTTQWVGTRSVGSVLNGAPALAVEVQPSHVTWFFGGRPVGTVRGAASGKEMTLRLAMVGAPGTEMNKTQLFSDWQRGFAAEPGNKVMSGAALSQRALTGC